jgi:curved DNA-binding protein
MNMDDIMEDLKGTSFAENFDKYFGGQFGKGGGRGADIQVELNMTLEDVYKGCDKTFTYFEKAAGGTTQESRPISIKIGRGIANGQKLRIKGKGHANVYNSELPHGDLIITVRVMPNMLFRREGNNIYYEANVPLYTALLGGDIYIPAVVGSNRIKVRIPELCKQGQFLKLKSKGMPIYDTEYNWGPDSTAENVPERYGDMIIEVNIVIPDKLTSKERELFEQLKKLKEVNDKDK